MLSLGGARGIEKAELNGNVDSDNNHGGSSRTYVLHRTGCSQEDDQLLRQGRERSGSAGRQGWGNAMGTGRLDEDASATLEVAMEAATIFIGWIYDHLLPHAQEAIPGTFHLLVYAR
jgi:transposase